MNSTDSVRARLAEIKAENAKKAAQPPTPLATFLTIYSKTKHECYINYMQGARALYKYLSPISFPDRALVVSKNLSSKVRVFPSYDLYELAKILAIPYSRQPLEERLRIITEIEEAIIYSLFYEMK